MSTTDLNAYEAVFYHKLSRMESERVENIRAMNPMEAERIAWQEFDARHANERNIKRDMYRISVRGPGQ